MDDLIQQLNQLRIERANAALEHQRSQQSSNSRERTILSRIVAEREREHREREQGHHHTNGEREQGHHCTNGNQTRKNLRNNRENPIKMGELVRITNDYNGGYGVSGVVTHIGGRMVDICCAKTRKRYTRAWWNLERVEPRHDSQ